jgi:hypothetical protein
VKFSQQPNSIKSSWLPLLSAQEDFIVFNFPQLHMNWLPSITVWTLKAGHPTATRLFSGGGVMVGDVS